MPGSYIERILDEPVPFHKHVVAKERRLRRGCHLYHLESGLRLPGSEDEFFQVILRANPVHLVFRDQSDRPQWLRIIESDLMPRLLNDNPSNWPPCCNARLCPEEDGSTFDQVEIPDALRSLGVIRLALGAERVVDVEERHSRHRPFTLSMKSRNVLITTGEFHEHFNLVCRLHPRIQFPGAGLTLTWYWEQPLARSAAMSIHAPAFVPGLVEVRQIWTFLPREPASSIQGHERTVGDLLDRKLASQRRQLLDCRAAVEEALHQVLRASWERRRPLETRACMVMLCAVAYYGHVRWDEIRASVREEFKDEIGPIPLERATPAALQEVQRFAPLPKSLDAFALALRVYVEALQRRDVEDEYRADWEIGLQALLNRVLCCCPSACCNQSSGTRLIALCERIRQLDPDVPEDRIAQIRSAYQALFGGSIEEIAQSFALELRRLREPQSFRAAPAEAASAASSRIWQLIPLEPKGPLLTETLEYERALETLLLADGDVEGMLKASKELAESALQAAAEKVRSQRFQGYDVASLCRLTYKAIAVYGHSRYEELLTHLNSDYGLELEGLPRREIVNAPFLPLSDDECQQAFLLALKAYVQVADAVRSHGWSKDVEGRVLIILRQCVVSRFLGWQGASETREIDIGEQLKRAIVTACDEVGLSPKDSKLTVSRICKAYSELKSSLG